MAIPLRNKLSVISNRSFTPIPNGEYSKPIQIKPYNIITNNFHYANGQNGELLSAENLTNLTGINNVNGAPTGVPPTDGMYLQQAGYPSSSWYNIGSYNTIFDLGGYYNIDYAYVWIGDDTRGEFMVFGSEDGVQTNYKTLFEPRIDLPREQWVKLEFPNEQAKAGNRFVIMGVESFSANIKAFVIYGRPIGEILNKGAKFKRLVSIRRTDEFMGTNGFYMEDPFMMANVSNCQRFYVVPQWFLGDALVNAGAGEGLTPYDIIYRWTNADEGNIDQYLQGYKNAGAKVMIDVNASPAFLRRVNTPKAQYSKAVDPGYSSVNLADTTDPMKYTFIARIYWVWAARYGSNKNIDTSQIILQGDQPMRVGLGLVEVIEAGNEFDRFWEGAQMYHNPQEMAAYMSAVYDGHKGAMGPGFGIKTADPSMKVSLISTASGDNINYVKEIILWCDKYRGKGDYPFDILNYHWYNSTEGSQSAGDTAGSALQPERGTLIDANLRWVDFRDRYCPNVEVWDTETGYDEHYGGAYSPGYVTQFERSRYKAYWLLRMYMINQMTGVDVTNQYWYSNHGVIRLEDTDQYEPDPSKFLTCGLVDGIQNESDWNRKPLMSYWYVAQFKTRITGYRFSHIIMERGVSNVIGTSIVNSTQENIWAFAYKNYKTGENLIAIWLDSEGFRSRDVQVKVSEQNVTVTKIDEAEIRQALIGIDNIIPSVNGYINLTINECPQFIKTADVGIPKLKPVERFEVQELANGNKLLTFIDRNIDETQYVVERSLTPTGTYTVIYQGDIYEGTWTDQIGDPGATYYYRVTPIYPEEEVVNITPPAPNVAGNDETNVLSAYSQLYQEFLVYNVNGGTYQPYTGQLNIGNVARPAGYYKFKIASGYGRNESAIVDSPAFTAIIIDDPNFYILNAAEATADHAYYGKHPNNRNLAGITPVEGDSVIRFSDLKGTAHINYEGVESPALFGRAPWLIDDHVDSDNIPDIPYYSANFAGRSLPFEFSGTLTKLPCQDHEAFFNDYNSYYLGYSNNRMRIVDQNGSLPNSTVFKDFFKSYYHVLVDVGVAKLWINGVSQGEITHSYARQLLRTSIFTNTNNASQRFYNHFVWKQKMSDADRISRMASIMAKHNCNTEITEPYAYNVNPIFNRATNTWGVTYATKNLSGSGIDLASTQYEWIINFRQDGVGAFSRQFVIGTGATLTKASYQAFAQANNPNNHPTYFRVKVKAIDNNGLGKLFVSCPGYVQESNF